MRTSQKVFAFLVMCAFILPNLYAITQGREAFPFTPAPMFGHYIGPKTYFYDINFIGQNRKTDKILYPTLDKNMEHTQNFSTMRFFLNKVYGSAEDISPLGYFEQDTPTKFQERMESFIPNYFKADLSTDTTHIDTIRLEVSQYDRSYKLQAKHIIGYYDVQSKNFKHTWKSKP